MPDHVLGTRDTEVKTSSLEAGIPVRETENLQTYVFHRACQVAVPAEIKASQGMKEKVCGVSS